MALTLSSLIVVMVAGTFLAQNRSYQVQLGVTDSHHNARAVTELLSSELRLVMEGGVVLAENDEITVRTPIVVAAVCWTDGVLVGVHTEGGEAAIETRAEEVTGFGVMDGVGGVGLLRRRLGDDRRRELEQRRRRVLLRQRGRHGGSP